MKIAANVTGLIGNTPLVMINSLSSEYGAKIIGKCEFMNPTGSVKDRIGFNMIRRAIEKGLIDNETTIIEPTSGNTGIALASVCAAMGLKLILTMPESMSMERRKLLVALGAKLELTPADKGMKGAVDKAYELLEKIKNSYMPNQFDNPFNPEIHRLTTAKEILEDTEGNIDIFIAAVGTGGTLTGVGEELKKHNPDIKIFAVEPQKSAVLSGGEPGPHKIQGIGAGFVPKILNTKIYGEVIRVKDEDAIEVSREIAKKEGLLVGISSGANLWAACQVAKRYPGSNIVTILCDTGERYLSTELFAV
ncbi:cysteine synthase A [Nitrosophilus alvini]|uniref:cysteine synthase A n=1 Tax=Nitrosophilus alvini TaxID=2714855 RepID=UPI00190A8EEE|nr:cysteine synthase A [Nitrosophilus alvini]